MPDSVAHTTWPRLACRAWQRSPEMVRSVNLRIRQDSSLWKGVAQFLNWTELNTAAIDSHETFLTQFLPLLPSVYLYYPVFTFITYNIRLITFITYIIRFEGGGRHNLVINIRWVDLLSSLFCQWLTISKGAVDSSAAVLQIITRFCDLLDNWVLYSSHLVINDLLNTLGTVRSYKFESLYLIYESSEPYKIAHAH